MKSLSEYERDNAEAVKRFRAAKRKQARAIVRAYLSDVAAQADRQRRLVAAITRALMGES